MTRWCLSFRLGRALLQMYIIFFSKYMWMFNSPDSVINVTCLFLSINSLRSSWKQWPGRCSRLAPGVLCVTLSWAACCEGLNLQLSQHPGVNLPAWGNLCPMWVARCQEQPKLQGQFKHRRCTRALCWPAFSVRVGGSPETSTVIRHTPTAQAVTPLGTCTALPSRWGTGIAGLHSLCVLRLQVLWNACSQSLCKDLRLLAK